jgi:hypothetical protein
MNDLVFELRQEMEDLNYRLQALDAKVERCLQLLSSLQGALTEEKVAEMPRKASDDATSGLPHTTQRPVYRESAEKEHDSRATGVERDATSEPDYEPTYIEEEPWPEDLAPKWPTFSPGV